MNLSLACGLYDRTLPLFDASVRADGVDLDVQAMGGHELFRRQARDAQFDVSEMSLSTYAMLVSRDDDRMVGIPVFPSRMFRHAFVWVHDAAGIAEPNDLVGSRVGVMEYQQTAAVWIRAALQHDFGVRAEDVDWYTGGYNEPEAFVERVPLELPPAISLTNIGPDRSLDEMLAGGELAGLMGAFPPKSFVSGSPAVRRLFPDYRAVETDYYVRTGFFPIMHLVVLRRSLYERDPWLAESIYAAFSRAKDEGRRRIHTPNILHTSMAWQHQYLRDEAALLGDDPFAYGVTVNREHLSAFLGYALEQGLLRRPVTVDELFATEMLAS